MGNGYGIGDVFGVSKKSATNYGTSDLRIKDRSIATEQVYVERGRLEDVFRQLTGGEQGSLK